MSSVRYVVVTTGAVQMQIVIDIPKEHYRTLQEAMKNHMESLIGKIILNGTVLPKGHGRLIDADELYLSIQTDEQQRLGEHLRYVYDEIQNAYTVLEADKESAE